MNTLELLTDKTKIVAVGHVSNALGTINPIEHIISTAHKVGALVVDRWRAISSSYQRLMYRLWTVTSMLFQAIKCMAQVESVCFMVKKHLLNDMPPYQGGGEMILTVSFRENNL